MSDNSAELIKISEGIRTLLCRAVENVSSMVKDLRDDGYTDASTQTVDMANKFVADYDAKDLVKELMSKHERWQRVLDRDMKFYIEDIPELLSKIPDIQVLAEPIKIYKKHEAEGFKNCGGKENFPIGTEDFDAQWVLFERIIKGACAYNMKSANPNQDIMKYNKKVGL